MLNQKAKTQIKYLTQEIRKTLDLIDEEVDQANIGNIFALMETLESRKQELSDHIDFTCIPTKPGPEPEYPLEPEDIPTGEQIPMPLQNE